MKARIDYIDEFETIEYACRYDDFMKGQKVEDKARKWQEAYFQLISWKNTWCGVLELDINVTASNVAYVDIVIRAEKAEALEELLDKLGYVYGKEDGKSVVYSVDCDEEEMYQVERVSLY